MIAMERTRLTIESLQNNLAINEEMQTDDRDGPILTLPRLRDALAWVRDSKASRNSKADRVTKASRAAQDRAAHTRGI